MEATLTKPKCKRCSGELSEDPKRECLVCLTCYPNALKAPAIPLPAADPKKYLDVAMTEARVREIVRDELENWHIHKPPVTRDEIEDDLPTHEDFLKMDWRGKAKELGIPLNRPTGGARKKVDVLAEIAKTQKTAGLNETL